MAWKKTTEKDYWYALECLPPALMNGLGFLLGEPHDHRTCAVTGDIRASYAAFAHLNGQYYQHEPMTVPEFKATKLADVLKAA